MNWIPAEKKIKLAIVGCGRISKSHFAAIEKHADQIELVAICDDNSVVLSEHADRYKVPSYLRLTEMLEKEQIDIVVFYDGLVRDI